MKAGKIRLLRERVNARVAAFVAKDKEPHDPEEYSPDDITVFNTRMDELEWILNEIQQLLG